MLSLSSGPVGSPARGVGRGEDRRQDREVLGHVVRHRERGERPAGDQQLLADLDDLDQLRRIRVEVHHVPRLSRGLGAGVHGHAHVRLRQRGGVVRAVAGHGHELAVALALADQLELALGRGLGEEVVHARLVGDLGGGERVVAGDHHRLDAHRPQLVEAVADPLLDHVLQVDHAQHLAVARDRERRAALAGHPVDRWPSAPRGACPPRR